MSPQVTEITGMPVAGSLGDGWIGFVHPEDMVDVQARWAMSLRTGERYDMEYRIRQADATYRWFHVHGSPRCNADGVIVRWYGIIEDIDDQRSSSARVEHLAYHDGLTGLPNRAQFRRLLEQQVGRVERGASFALLRLDLDDFKAINDTLGYVSGDILLMEVAARLAGSVRHTDILARSGNDEFFILQTDLCQPEDAALLADRIGTVLMAPIRLDGTPVGIGASIGITLCPQDGAIIDKLLQNSDLALERAKQDARGSYRFFEPDMDERLRLRQALKIELRDALDRDELELAYQPLVGLPDGRIHGFEALLRWRHPTRGFVSPAEFIPTAEKTGLILPIGRWVLERACRDAAGWPGDIRIAVNLSTVQFRQRALVETVAAALELSGLDPQRLELEITESVLLLDDDANLATLHQLRGLGVRIVLDDFGTGYASLGYLTRFAFDKLKIDRSFVARMTDTPDTQTIVNAVLRMSQALGIATTAEGVETREQLDILARAGCDELQGFFFSHPVPLSMVPGVIARHDARREREGWCSTMIVAADIIG
jgi:diguanylate cyclase (GGDEF)-like protein/PAS domain S-box-containing protein